MFDDASSFDRAMKTAIKASGRNPGEAYRQMLRDRFLCRIFYKSNQYVLKGGSGMLARVADARATRDVDLALLSNESAENVVADLKALAETNLGDWCRFVLDRYDERLDENGCSRLLCLRFSSYIGEQEKDPVLIDVSLDSCITDLPQRITPASRVVIDELVVSEYLVYPIADQIAEKVCAITEEHGGLPSSRVKDLIDLVIIASHETVSGSKLHIALASEFFRRGIAMIDSFAIPTQWEALYPRMAQKALQEKEYHRTDAALILVQKMIDPALQNLVSGKHWCSEEKCWL